MTKKEFIQLLVDSEIPDDYEVNVSTQKGDIVETNHVRITPHPDEDTKQFLIDVVESVKIDQLHEGAEVYWTDPDNGTCSGYYTITEIVSDEVVRMKNNQGSETEAFVHELS